MTESATPRGAATILPAGAQAPRFRAELRTQPQLSSQRSSRAACHPRVLSGRLEPGVRRSGGALQRDSSRVRRLRRRLCSASPSMASGATPRSRAIAICISLCSPTSSPRAQSRGRMGSTGRRRAWPSARCSWSTRTVSSGGATVSPIGVNPGADGILDALESFADRPAPDARSKGAPTPHRGVGAAP